MRTRTATATCTSTTTTTTPTTQVQPQAEIRNVKFGTNIKTDVEVEGQFVPYAIDAWTGKATELADYRWEDGKTIVPVDLDQNDIALMAFEKVEQHERCTSVAPTPPRRTRSTDGVAVRATAERRRSRPS